MATGAQDVSGKLNQVVVNGWNHIWQSLKKKCSPWFWHTHAEKHPYSLKKPFKGTILISLIWCSGLCLLRSLSSHDSVDIHIPHELVCIRSNSPSLCIFLCESVCMCAHAVLNVWANVLTHCPTSSKVTSGINVPCLPCGFWPQKIKLYLI